MSYSIKIRYKNFNPRSREGSDTRSRVRSINIQNFNPRSREGSDDDADRFFEDGCISIHAPVKGATFIQRKVYYIYKDFNPRSREGSDRSIWQSIARAIFQSTLP